MRQHHADSVKNMTAHFRADERVRALFLIGSIATETARDDSDVDGVAIISQEEYQRRRQNEGTLEVVHGKCTYPGGYFDIHYHTRECLEHLAQNGSEPMRNMFSNARVLFCDEPDLAELAAKIPVYPKIEAAKKQLRFYCTFKQYYGYFWCACKPTGFFRHHVADGMVFNLYRLILIENEILFPSVRKLEDAVISAPNKPAGVVELAQKLLQTLDDNDCGALVSAYESWTSYDFPKDHNTVMNNFADSWEWN
ncbi:MAG: nucleotidyltransferase domain-containing protein [Defluviitaleaceae bacterium]|nr:nucleotidyltransferase domain-containing protein [Defluviitaleaceae bacterium]